MKPILAVIRSIKVAVSSISYKAYLVILCFVLISPTSLGTCIFVVVHNGKIWIAADSLQISNIETTTRYACKINSERRFYWAASSPDYEDLQTGYSIGKMVSKAALTKGSILNKMNSLIDIAKIDSAKEFSGIKRKDPKYFGTLIQPDNTFLVAKIVFIEKREGRNPQVVDVVLTGTGADQIVVNGVPITPTTELPNVNFELGPYQTAQDYFLAHAKNIQNDPSQIMRDAVIAEERAHPQYIGGAVSVLEIAPPNSHWAEKGICQ